MFKRFVGVGLALAVSATFNWSAAQTPKLPIHNGSKILFVGNSYTNNGGGMDSRFVAVAAADNPPMTVTADKAIMFAVDVDVFWNSGPGPNMIRTGGYDVVVLQPWEYPASQPATFYQYATLFDQLCDSVGAQMVIFCPWAMTTHNWYLAYQQYEPACDTMGRRANAPVIHVGREWWDLRTGFPLSRGVRPKVGGVFLDSLFMFADAIHPNDSGQYINALCCYAFMTNKSPSSLGPTVGGITMGAEIQDTLQARVWKSVTYDCSRWYSVGVDNGSLLPRASRTGLPVGAATVTYTLQGAALPANAAAAAPGVYLRRADAVRPSRQLTVLP